AYSAQAGLQPAGPGPGGTNVPAGYATTSLSEVTVADHGIQISGMDPLYVATPAVLAHYGISPSAIDPTADVLSGRSALQGLKLFPPVTGAEAPGSGAGPRAGGPEIPKVDTVAPKIQHVAQLPLYTSAPGTLLTPGAVQRLGLQTVPAAWLI